jgi:hypothetical protein
MSNDTSLIYPTLFEDVVNKIEKSTASVTELRLPIFAPVQKLSGNSATAKEFKKNGGIRTIKTSWGKVEIRGRTLLTQIHRDILDCIYTHASKIEEIEGGMVLIKYSQTKILKEYRSDKSKSWGTKTSWLKAKLKEIKDINIGYEDIYGNSFDFNIISNMGYRTEDKTYAIILDPGYLKFYRSELTVNYKKELPKLLKVESASIRAVVRWFFTHNSNAKYSTMTVLEALGFPVDSTRSVQLIKKEFKDQADIFESFGITYDAENEIFHYGNNPNIGFVPSISEESFLVENGNTPI